MKIMKKWKVLGEKTVYDGMPRITVAIQKIQLPDGRIVDDYHRLYFPDAVMMVAYTKGKKLIMCRQYLHGQGRVSLVIPSGTVDKGERPLVTAKRELVEETGYSSGNWTHLKTYICHSSYHCGNIHYFLVKDAVKICEPKQADLEEMETVLLSKGLIKQAIRSGLVVSLGTITALSMASIWDGKVRAKKKR
jgi:ADP-ribose pyrophosphatase